MNILMLAVPAFIACACNSLANALWKAQFIVAPLQTSSISAFLNSVLNVRIFAGIACYGISLLLFFYLLSTYRLSQVVPFLASTYIFNFLIASLFFHEAVSGMQIVGILLIIFGVVLSNV